MDSSQRHEYCPVSGFVGGSLCGLIFTQLTPKKNPLACVGGRSINKTLGESRVLSRLVGGEVSVLLSRNSWLVFSGTVLSLDLLSNPHAGALRQAPCDSAPRDPLTVRPPLCCADTALIPRSIRRRRRGQLLAGLADQRAAIAVGQLAVFAFASLIYNQRRLFFFGAWPPLLWLH